MHNFDADSPTYRRRLAAAAISEMACGDQLATPAAHHMAQRAVDNDPMPPALRVTAVEHQIRCVKVLTSTCNSTNVAARIACNHGASQGTLIAMAGQTEV